MVRLRLALSRGFRLRCPECGRGRLRTRWLDFADSCPECRHVYLADPGDWTGAAETSFILTVAAGIAAWLALGEAGFEGTARVVATLMSAVVAFAFIFPRVRGLWIGLLLLWNDPRPVPALAPSDRDPDWEHPSLLGKP